MTDAQLLEASTPTNGAVPESSVSGGSRRRSGRPKGSPSRKNNIWTGRINTLRRKVLHGQTLTTEEIESVLLWKALGLVSELDADAAQKGLDMLSAIYETRSKAKLAPGNAPAKPKASSSGEKYGVSAPERVAPKQTEASEETPRRWLPDQEAT